MTFKTKPKRNSKKQSLKDKGISKRQKSDWFWAYLMILPTVGEIGRAHV